MSLQESEDAVKAIVQYIEKITLRPRGKHAIWTFWTHCVIISERELNTVPTTLQARPSPKIVVAATNAAIPKSYSFLPESPTMPDFAKNKRH
jgi:hypothetical protein